MPRPDVYVYLDEFERGDTFVLSTVFVPVDVASQLLADWDALRQRIKTVLLAEYPDAKFDKRLGGNQLPEIHAVELFQSQGYYRKNKRGENLEDKYWLQHYAWLEEALEIISRYDLNFYAFPYTKSRHLGNAAKIFDNFRLTLDLIDKRYPRPDRHTLNYSEAKLQRLRNSIYFFTLPLTLTVIERFLRDHNLHGEIVCDDHDMSKGFEVTESITWLQERERFVHLARPRFASGLDEPLLQVADVLCYVFGRQFHAYQEQKKVLEPLGKWHSQYLDPMLSKVHKQFIGYDIEDHSHVLWFELMVEECVFNPKARRYLKETFRKLMDF